MTIKCLATWGDLFYLGLDRLEVYNLKGEQILTTSTHITATPYPDLTHLPSMHSDTRSVSNLVKSSGQWLVPFSPLHSTTIELLLPEYTSLASLTIHNYSKTPLRATKKVMVYIDQALVYKGYLNNHPTLNHTSILFT